MSMTKYYILDTTDGQNSPIKTISHFSVGYNGRQAFVKLFSFNGEYQARVIGINNSYPSERLRDGRCQVRLDTFLDAKMH